MAAAAIAPTASRHCPLIANATEVSPAHNASTVIALGRNRTPGTPPISRSAHPATSSSASTVSPPIVRWPARTSDRVPGGR